MTVTAEEDMVNAMNTKASDKTAMLRLRGGKHEEMVRRENEVLQRGEDLNTKNRTYFTDGSGGRKGEGKGTVGWATYRAETNEARQGSMRTTNVMMAELEAIRRTLQWDWEVSKGKLNNVTIVTDCLSAMEALKHGGN